MGTQVVTRDELDLYDHMKFMSYLMFLMSILVVAMGKCGLRAVWREKSKVGKRMMKKSAMVFVVIALIGMMGAHQGKEMHRIVKRYIKHEDKHEHEEQATKRETEEFDKEEFLKNRHDGMYTRFFQQSNDACTFADAASCDAAASCTWCKSAAVASRCYDVADAKKLPSSIFACDKAAEEVEEAIVEPVHHFDFYQQSNDACSFADAGSCDAAASCTWCKSAAVASRCYDVADAKKLPSSIFACDKAAEEVKSEMEPVHHHHERKADFFQQSNAVCTFGDSDSCDAADSCTWCKSAAVASRCYDVADAKNLPSSIFACDKLSEEDSDDDMEGYMQENINILRGKGHHGKKHHHGHGHGHHGHKLHRVVGPLILLIAVAAHFFNLNKFAKALEEKETLKGESHDGNWGCHWGKQKKCDKKEKKVAQAQEPEQQPQSFAPSSSPIVMPVQMQ